MSSRDDVLVFFKSSLFLHFLPSLSVHLLKSLRQGGAHQISIVDLLMPRSGLQRQRFHTQDEREMNTEDAGGDMGPWPGQPLPLWPLHCTGLGSERSRGGGAQIEVSHLYNNSHPSLPPKMAEHRLVFSYLIVNHRVLLISDEAQEKQTLRPSHVSWNWQVRRVDVPWDRNWTSRRFNGGLFFFTLPSLPPGAGAIWNIPWCLVSDLQLASPVTSAHYCCISLRPLLNEDWDKAGSEWTAWSRRPEAGAPRSNVPPKYLSAS